MKVSRLLKRAIGIFLLVDLALLLFAFTSPGQTWLARRAVADLPDTKIELSRIDIGLQHVTAENVSVEKDGLVLKLPSAVLDLPVIAAASRRDLHLRTFVAKGWILDLSRYAPTPSTAQSTNATATVSSSAPQPFTGLLKSINLPADLAVDSLDLAGEIIFPGQAGKPPVKASVTVSGGKLRSGQTGVIHLTAVVINSDADAPVSRVNLDTSLAVTMDTPRTLSGLALTAKAEATGHRFPEPVRLETDLKITLGTLGELYDIVLKTTQAGVEKKLVRLQTSRGETPTTLAGQWSLDFATHDLEPFLLGRKLPASVVTGAGTFTTDTAFVSAHVDGKLALSISSLASVNPELAHLGTCHLLSDFSATKNGSLLRIDHLTTDFNSETPVATFRTLQSFSYDTANASLVIADPTADLLQITLRGVPLSWAQPFLPDFKISGAPLSGELIIKSQNGAFNLRTASPLSLRQLSVNRGAQPLVAGLDISLSPQADYTSNGWQFAVPDLSIHARSQSLLKLSLKAARLAGAGQPIKAEGHLDAALAPLITQPLLAEHFTSSRGSVAVDFTTSLSAAVQQIAAKISATQLFDEAGVALPSIDADLRADYFADGHLEAQIPLSVELAARKTDLSIVATGLPASTPTHVDLQLSSTTLYLEDLKAFSRLLKTGPVSQEKSTTAAAPVVVAAPPADSAPVWSAMTGSLQLALKAVYLNSTAKPFAAIGSVKITTDALTVESLKARFQDGGEATTSGTVKFKTGSLSPYNYDAKVAAANIDPGPFLTTANPGRPAVVEGKFDINGVVTGTAPTLERAAETANADLKLNSRGGKFRGFESSAKLTKLEQNAQKASSVLSSALSIYGAIKGDEKAVSAAAKLEAARSVVAALSEFSFDQFDVDVSQRPGEAAIIKNLSLISPDLRLVGSGTISQAPGLSIWNRPLACALQLSARGGQAQNFQTLGLLRDTADNLGYLPLHDEFKLDGALADMTADTLLKAIAQAVR